MDFEYGIFDAVPAVLQHQSFFFAMLVRKKAGGREIVMRKTIGDVMCETSSTEIPDMPVYLRIEAVPCTYTFLYSMDGENFIPLDHARTTYLGPELASAWTGVFFAMYASGNGKNSETPADFKWFDYEPGEAVNEIRF